MREVETNCLNEHSPVISYLGNAVGQLLTYIILCIHYFTNYK